MATVYEAPAAIPLSCLHRYLMAFGHEVDIVIWQSGSENRGTLRFAAPELG